MERRDETFAYANFNDIMRRTLADLGASRMVKAFQVLADPAAPWFLISMKMGRARDSIKVPDMATVDGGERGASITIINEEWAPALLTKLWQRYGRDNVEQLTRFDILVRGADADEISALELDPGEELRTRLLDALWRVFPEGFTVRYDIVDDEVLTGIGTEHDMDPAWIEKAHLAHKMMREREEDA